MSVPAFLHPFSPPTRESFLSIDRGLGSTVWDTSGRAYLDAMGSLWYANVGHGHPRIVEAIATQAAKLASYHCYAPFTNPPADALAEAIADRAPLSSRPRVFFTSSGSEAVDAAIKIARVAHEQSGRPHKDLVVSRDRGYHGVTYGGTSAQGLPANQVGFGPLVPDIEQIPQHDTEALERLFSEHGERMAAFLTEPVQCAGGVHPPHPGYLERVRALCDAHDVYLIHDEVVTGFGRLGTWFGSEAVGVEPDLITFAKAVTSGYVPLGGVVVGPAVRGALEADPQWMLRHGHTYSGHPLACATGLACMQVTEDEGLLERASELGVRFRRGLGELVDAGLLRDVRGAGAVYAAVLPEDRDAGMVRDDLLELGVIVRPIADVIAVCPPLVMTDGEADQVVEAIGQSLR